jgi:hypothetical protein
MNFHLAGALGDLALSIVSRLRQLVFNIAHPAQDKTTHLKCRPDDDGQNIAILMMLQLPQRPLHLHRKLYQLPNLHLSQQCF